MQVVTDRPTLRTALVCAHEIMGEQRDMVAWVVRIMALGLLLAGQERERARAQTRDLATRLTDAARDASQDRRHLDAALRALDRACDRFVLAEARVERALMMLPRLREPANRRELAAAVDAVERALKES